MTIEELEALAEKANSNLLADELVKHCHEIIAVVRAAKDHLELGHIVTETRLAKALAAFEDK